jgi:1,2-dihydroxy-3-keto-5-methylthiopentene dioxygenase
MAMARLNIPDENVTLTDGDAIAAYLATCGVDYEQWLPEHVVAADAPADEILRAYAKEIDQLNSRGGYVTADVIDVNPETPGLEEMLAKFNREHWHDEDEVRFIIDGHGLFHIRSAEKPVVAIEVEPGDLIRVPRGTRHWFNLCADRRIRAIRLFQDAAGWTPLYTESGAEGNFLPVCFGVTHLAQSIRSPTVREG